MRQPQLGYRSLGAKPLRRAFLLRTPPSIPNPETTTKRQKKKATRIHKGTGTLPSPPETALAARPANPASAASCARPPGSIGVVGTNTDTDSRRARQILALVAARFATRSTNALGRRVRFDNQPGTTSPQEHRTVHYLPLSTTTTNPTSNAGRSPCDATAPAVCIHNGYP